MCPRSPRTTSTTKPIVGLIHLRVRAGGVLGDDDDDVTEYEAIRAHSTHFGVVPQHEQPETRASSSGTRATSSSRSASRTLRR